MKRFRLLLAAVLFSLVTTACSSDLLGPDPAQPTYDESTGGQGGFGSGG